VDPKFGLHKKKQEAKNESPGTKFVRSVADYTRKEQITNTTIRELPNIFNLSN
jgi:hypothetical protein